MRLIFGLAAALLIGAAMIETAQPQSADCQRLQQAIVAAGHGGNGPNAQFEAAAQRQRGEIDTTSLTRDRSGAKSQIPVLRQRSAATVRADQRANLPMQRISPTFRRAAAAAMAVAQNCRPLQFPMRERCAFAVARHIGRRYLAIRANNRRICRLCPLFPTEPPIPTRRLRARARKARGSKAVCVRSCDGSFFPVPSSAGSSRLDELQDMCRALCRTRM